jgi:hypothetical protein
MRILTVAFCVIALIAGTSLRAAEPAAAPALAPRPPAEVFAALVRQNDAQVTPWLATDLARFVQPREVARALKMTLAAYGQRESALHHRADALELARGLGARLQAQQNPDGSFDAELAAGNPESPPDSAFAIRHLAQAQALLRLDAHEATRALRDEVEAMLAHGAKILRTGGVHTPNHRWVICGALSFLQTLQPAPENVARIDAWLGEGIDQDRDGQFSERSTIYSGVTDEALLDLALNLGRPALLEPIRRNLEHWLYLAEPNGELETVASRRQDQLGREPRRLAAYYIPLRYLALELGQGAFATAVAAIERDDLARVTDSLVEWILWPALRRELPRLAAWPDDFVRHFADSGLVRFRRGNRSASVFGGSDWHAQRDIASGLSTNPTFFKFRKGAAVLESVRLAPGFFNLGYFRSEGIAFAGTPPAVRLRQTLRAAYYQPLPAALRRADGDYPLTNDGRFYSKMDFPQRPKDVKELTTEIAVRERDSEPGTFTLAFDVSGTDGIAVVIELCFRPGGTLEGVEPHTQDAAAFYSKSGPARYTVGQDTIEFGPGAFATTRVNLTGGESYTWRNGQLRAEGLRVYLSGVTPFRHTLTIR